jgi:hypothetical protein
VGEKTWSQIRIELIRSVWSPRSMLRYGYVCDKGGCDLVWVPPYLKTFLMHIRSRNKPRYGLGERRVVEGGIGLVYHMEPGGSSLPSKSLIAQKRMREGDLSPTYLRAVCWIINSNG